MHDHSSYRVGRSSRRVLDAASACVLALLGAAALPLPVPARALARAASSAQAGPASVVSAGSARLSLGAPRDVLTSDAAKSGGAALSVAAADVDGDGHVDVVTGFAAGKSGRLSIALGRGDGDFAEGAAVSIPVRPELLVSGDFDGDGRADLAAAARGGRSVYVLRGDGSGQFGAPAKLATGGAVTALAAGELGRRDLRDELAVGAASTGAAGGFVAAFSNVSTAPVERARVAVDGAPAAVALADVDGDALRDLSAAVGSNLVVVAGTRGGAGDARVERFAEPLLSLAPGRFAGGSRLAVLGRSGAVTYLSPAPGAFERAEGATLDGAVGIVAAKVSTGVGDDVVALGGGADLRVLAGAANGAELLQSSTGVVPAAAVAVRINGDALDDVVAIDGTGGSARVIATAAVNTFTVTNTNDSGDGSLRKAILDANGSPGADRIAFSISGTGLHSILVDTELPQVTEPLEIDGFSQSGSHANTLATGNNALQTVEINGLHAPVDTSGILINEGSTVVRGLRFVNFAADDDGFGGAGVEMLNTGGNVGNVVEGCVFGLAPSGQSTAGNSFGVRAGARAVATIGSDAPAGRNVITASDIAGVFCEGASNMRVVNNFFNTDAEGTGSFSTPGDGVAVSNGTDNVVGEVGRGNVIAAGDFGIHFVFEDSAFNVASSNLVGVTADGAPALARLSVGVVIDAGADDNLVSTNTFVDADGAGILVEDAGTDGNEIQENFVGTNAKLTPGPGNGAAGIAVISGATRTEVINNTIAFNGDAGVLVEGGNATADIRLNRIFQNGTLGIDLEADGVTLNDAGDPDGGSNHRQNFPVISSATRSAGSIKVAGTLDSEPNKAYTVDIFASVNAQGARPLGTFTVTADATGHASFAATVQDPDKSAVAITSTATDDTRGETSEFSAPSTVTDATGGEVHGAVFSDNNGNAERDAGEPGLSGVTVFVDRNDNGKPDAGEPSTTTGSDGSYAIVLSQNETVKVREVVPFGFTQTTPNPQPIAISGGAVVSNVDFGNRPSAGLVCLFDDKTGDVFSIVTAKTDPLFGVWQYRSAKTGRAISGKANRLSFPGPDALRAQQFGATTIDMSANVLFKIAEGTATVLDPATGKSIIVKDTVAGGSC